MPWKVIRIKVFRMGTGLDIHVWARLLQCHVTHFVYVVHNITSLFTGRSQDMGPMDYNHSKYGITNRTLISTIINKHHHFTIELFYSLNH